jgi:APA family basic amino acid/polyamine antiporter
MAETTKTTISHFKPTLGLLDGTMIVAGSMIGSGIFIVSSTITQLTGSAGWLVFVWLVTGFMTISAAVSYGELSGMFPKAGGQYIYLKEAYNPLTGFLYGWSFFAVIQTATIAAVAVAFAKFAGYFFPSLELTDKNIAFSVGAIHVHYAELVAICLIVFLTWVNTRGIEGGKWIQRIFTVTKLLSLFGLVVFGFFFGRPACDLAAQLGRRLEDDHHGRRRR